MLSCEASVGQPIEHRGCGRGHGRGHGRGRGRGRVLEAVRAGRVEAETRQRFGWPHEDARRSWFTLVSPVRRAAGSQ
jgi:hypothetical protein